MVIESRTLRIAMGVVAAAALSLIVTGFEYGIVNNVFHIPYVLRYEQLPEFQTDAFYVSLSKFTTVVWPALRLVANDQNVEWLFLVGHYANRLLTFAALAILVCTTSGVRYVIAILTVLSISLCPWLLGRATFGDHELLMQYFTHSQVTWGPLLAALAAAQVNRWRAAAAFAGITFAINAFVGAWLVWVLVAVAVAERKAFVREQWSAVGIFFLLASPVVYWIARATIDAPTVPPFDYIEFLRLYWPRHFLIDSMDGFRIRNLSLLTYCGVAAAVLLKSRFWLNVLGAMVALLVVGSAVPYVTDARMVLNLHLLRSAGMLYFVAPVLVFMACWTLVTDGSMSRARRSVAVLAAGSLLTFDAEPTSLLLAAVCLTVLVGWEFYNEEFERIEARIPYLFEGVLVLAVVVACLDLWYIGPSWLGVARWVLLCGGIAFVMAGRLELPRGAHVGVAMAGVMGVVVLAGGKETRGRWIPDTPSAEQAALTEVEAWVRGSSLSGPFLFPVRSDWTDPFDFFQLRAMRRAWVDWRQGAAVMWEPGFYWQWMPRLREVQALSTAQEFADYAAARSIPQFILPSRMGACPLTSRLLFENEEFAICGTSK